VQIESAGVRECVSLSEEQRMSSAGRLFHFFVGHESVETLLNRFVACGSRWRDLAWWAQLESNCSVRLPCCIALP